MGSTRTISALLLLGLALTVATSEASVLSWLEGDEGELPQADDPDDSHETRDRSSSQIHRLVGAMRDSFVDLATKRNSWYDRYDALALQTANNSQVVTELLSISRIAMPIIWNTFMAKKVWQRTTFLKNGEAHTFPPGRYLPAPHPLRSLSTSLTKDDFFTFEIIVSLERETNVGLRLMWEPEPGNDFDWDNDDIFFSLHLRRYHPDNDREVVMNDKYDGQWTPDAARSPPKYWPAVKAGQKFEIIVVKRGPCFTVWIWIGKEIYVQLPKPLGYAHTFCPKPRRQSRIAQWEGRPLRLIMNEDNRGSGEVHVHAITWYPSPSSTTLQWEP